MTVVRDLSEFSWVDPDEVHLVKTPANGYPLPLLAKMAAEVDAVADAAVKEFVGGLCGVTGCSTCRGRLGTLSETQVAKARLDARARDRLGTKDFAFPKQRKEPLNDASHVRDAMARFGQVEDVSDKERKRAARRIVARAKHFGIDVSEDTDVAQAAKQTAPDKSVPSGEAESQTDEHLEGDPDTGVAPEAHDDGDATAPGTDERPSTSTGQGDTAPDKTLPVSAATYAQTDDAQKATVDMTGDPAPDGDAAAAEAKDEAQDQTRELHGAEKAAARSKAIKIARRLGLLTKEEAKAADGDPGSPAWEHKDVALGEEAESLVSRLAEVVHTFTEREKAEGGTHKSTSRKSTQTLQEEIDAMETSELSKLLDERDARLVKALRAEHAKAEKKAVKKAEHDDPERAAKREAKKAAKAAEQAAKAADDPTADLRETVVGLAKTVEAMASQDAKRIVTSPAGLTAALRGPESTSVFKELDDRVAEAESALEKASGEYGIKRATEALRHARQQRTTAKMIAAENARTADPAMLQRRLDGRGVPLFKNSGDLPDDRDLRFQ